MATYEYGRIDKLYQSLTAAGIADGVVAEIMSGGATIRKNTSPEKKAGWLAGAMRRMDRLLDRDTRQTVREACACCLGGKRLQISKAIARDNAGLADRVRAANEAKLVFGHGVSMEDDGTIRVCFSPEGLERYRCPCLPKALESLPITYCYCCGGHVKHHLQIALGRKVSGTVQTSALSSGGKQPCTFVFLLMEATGDRTRP